MCRYIYETVAPLVTPNYDEMEVDNGLWIVLGLRLHTHLSLCPHVQDDIHRKMNCATCVYNFQLCIKLFQRHLHFARYVQLSTIDYNRLVDNYKWAKVAKQKEIITT